MEYSKQSFNMSAYDPKRTLVRLYIMTINLKTILTVLLCFLFLNASVYGDTKLKPKENEAWVYIEKWVIMLDVKQQAGLAFTLDESDNKDTANLEITCYLKNHKGDGFDMTLHSDEGFDTYDFDSVDVKVAIDENPHLNNVWFPSGARLWSEMPQKTINEMLSGKLLNINFQDKNNLKSYKYNIKGFEEVINLMQKVCGYNYDGSKNK